MNLETALKVLADAMRPDELHTNDDGYTAKLNKLMATKAGRAKLRAALDQIDEEETDEDDESDEVTTNAMRPVGYFSQRPDKTTKPARAHNASDGPLGLPSSVLLAKPDKKNKEVA